MRLRVFVGACVHTRAYVPACRACMRVFAYVRICARARMCEFAHAYVRLCTCVCDSRVFVHLRACVCTKVLYVHACACPCMCGHVSGCVCAVCA